MGINCNLIDLEDLYLQYLLGDVYEEKRTFRKN